MSFKARVWPSFPCMLACLTACMLSPMGAAVNTSACSATHTRTHARYSGCCTRPTPEDARNLVGDVICFFLLTALAVIAAYLCLMGRSTVMGVPSFDPTFHPPSSPSLVDYGLPYQLRNSRTRLLLFVDHVTHSVICVYFSH